ncbi:MAG: histidinol-phosphatase HisJ [Candidatus Lokiarchaeota archaeon]|nr:histidinol-phosphatase HisJ [Candidatus Lokiarchaeota archaeon]
MILEDWHTHNELCHHAVGTLEDYARQAIKKGLTTIGFNDHFPYEFYNGIENVPYEEYSMRLDELDLYLATTKNLRDKYQKNINIKIGFEIEFIESQVAVLNSHLSPLLSELDYIHGSVHILSLENGLWPMDDERFIEVFEKIDIDDIYAQFYQHNQKMISSKEFEFDIVSHFDLPKKFNKLPVKKAEFIEQASQTLDLIKKNDLTMEVNTSGFRKAVKEQYPSNEILEIMYDLDIPILLGSDAHAPEEVGWEFEKMIQIIKKIGFTQLAHFTNRKRSFIDI